MGNGCCTKTKTQKSNIKTQVKTNRSKHKTEEKTKHSQVMRAGREEKWGIFVAQKPKHKCKHNKHKTIKIQNILNT